MPVTVVPTSFATGAIETFMTELSRVIRNWPDARVSRTSPVFWVRPTPVTGGWYPSGAPGGLDPRRPVVRRRRRRLPPGRDPIHLDVDRETQRETHHEDQDQNADGFEGLDGVVHDALEQHGRTIPCGELRSQSG